MSVAANIGSVFKAVCRCHKSPISVTGVIVSGAPNVLVCGSPLARLGDIGKASCGHCASIATSSATVLANSLGVARIGDIVNGCPIGVIVSGCSSVLAGG